MMSESTTGRTQDLQHQLHGGNDLHANTYESKASSIPRETSQWENKRLSPNEVAKPQGPRNYSRWQWASILVAIYSSQFLYGLDNTIVADIQGSVTEDFGEVGLLGWLGIGFPLGSVATILSL
jgi:hypothetical protein